MNDSNVRKTFKKNLNSIMWEKEISVAELSRKSGLSERTIFRYMRGDSIPDLIKLEALAYGLDISIFMLLVE